MTERVPLRNQDLVSPGGPSLVAIEPYVQTYPWGSVSEMAEFLQVEPTGGPMAEAWFGVHPSGPAVVRDDPQRRSLAELLVSRNQKMEFLLKVLSIAAPLSLQLHPTIDQARAGFADENRRGIPIADASRVFRDQNHKPELICALTELDALCGFREIADSVALLGEIGGHVATAIIELLRGGAGIRDILRRLLTSGDPLLGTGSVARLTSLSEFLEGATRAANRPHPAPHELALEWIQKLGNTYPGDGGVVVAALMNCVRIQPGEALFLAAGNLHAYLRGFGIEIMANSDNVVRGGLTSKHIAVDALTELVDSDPTPVPVVRAEWSRLVGGAAVERWPVPVRDFSLIRVTVARNESGTLKVGGHPFVVLCSTGEVTLSTNSEALSIGRGHAAYVAPEQDLSFSGYGEGFVATSAQT